MILVILVISDIFNIVSSELPWSSYLRQGFHSAGQSSSWFSQTWTSWHKLRVIFIVKLTSYSSIIASLTREDSLPLRKTLIGSVGSPQTSRETFRRQGSGDELWPTYAHTGANCVRYSWCSGDLFSWKFMAHRWSAHDQHSSRSHFGFKPRRLKACEKR